MGIASSAALLPLTSPLSSHVEDEDIVAFSVPYDLDYSLPWADLVTTIVPNTRLHDPVLGLGSDVLRPVPPPSGEVTLVLVKYLRGLECGPDSVRFALQNGLTPASPYHLLALAKHVPDVRSKLAYTLERGPGILATESVVPEDGWNEVGVGLWCPGEGVGCRAQLIPFGSGLGIRTYFLFTLEPWRFD